MKPVEKNAFEMERLLHDDEQRKRLRHSSNYALMTSHQRALVLFHAERLKSIKKIEIIILF